MLERLIIFHLPLINVDGIFSFNFFYRQTSNNVIKKYYKLNSFFFSYFTLLLLFHKRIFTHSSDTFNESTFDGITLQQLKEIVDIFAFYLNSLRRNTFT